MTCLESQVLEERQSGFHSSVTVMLFLAFIMAATCFASRSPAHRRRLSSSKTVRWSLWAMIYISMCRIHCDDGDIRSRVSQHEQTAFHCGA